VTVLPLKPTTGEEGTWRWGKRKVAESSELLIAQKVERSDDDEAWDVFQMDFLESADGEERTTKAKTLWTERELNYQNGTTELKALLGGTDAFAFPKPCHLMRKLIVLADCEDDDIVLDLFSGSGTTAQAVLELNREDGGNRRFVMVQLPEPTGRDDFATIADVGKERIRRVIARMEEQAAQDQGKLDTAERDTPEDLGFRVFRLDSTNIRAWEPDRDNLEETLLDSVDHLLAERTEADILYELLLKLGLDLCVPIETRTLAGKQLHSIGGGVLLACLAEAISRDEIEPLAQGTVEWHKALNPAGDTTCVFRDSAFADDVAKTNLTAILEQHGLANVRSL
jgi:adenine-specific DNA-methyltransferase